MSLARLDPLSQVDSEELLTYSLNGEILSINQNPDVEADLNNRLNLNDGKLVKFRKDQIDLAKKLLEKNYPRRNWNQRIFDREIEVWSAQTNGELSLT